MSDTVFLQIGPLQSCGEMARRPEIAACRNSGNPRQGSQHAHTPLFFKRRCRNVVKIVLINLKKISGFLLQYLHPAPRLNAFP